MEDVQVVAVQGGRHQDRPTGVKLEGQQGAGVCTKVRYQLTVDNVPHHDCAHKLSICGSILLACTSCNASLVGREYCTAVVEV